MTSLTVYQIKISKLNDGRGLVIRESSILWVTYNKLRQAGGLRMSEI